MARGKTTKKIEQKVVLENIELNKVNGQQLNSNLKKKRLNFDRKNNVEIIEFSDGQLVLKLIETIGFKPAGHFKLEIEVIGTYSCENDIKKEEIEEKIENIAYPIYRYTGLVIAFLTEKMASIPLILPPMSMEMINEE